MFKTALVGAVALATVSTLSISCDGVGISSASAQEVVVSHSQISRLKSALHLTADQEHLWRPVEATLRVIAHQQQKYRVASADSGFIERAQSRISGYALTAMSMQKLRAAAQPLIGRLNDDQKHAGMQVLQSMGVSF
jgi:hypothetical protein